MPLMAQVHGELQCCRDFVQCVANHLIAYCVNLRIGIKIK